MKQTKTIFVIALLVSLLLLSICSVYAKNDSNFDKNGAYHEDFSDGFFDRGWLNVTIAGDPEGIYYYFGENKMRFELPRFETYAFVVNDSEFIDDIYVETTFNLWRSETSSYSVACRMSADGWYEFRTYVTGEHRGSYQVFRYDQSRRDQGLNPYVLLHPGMDQYMTPDLINGPEKQNTIGIRCEGDTIRLFINGKEQHPYKGKYITDSTYSTGGYGFGVQSYKDHGTVKADAIDFYAEKL